MAGCSASKQLNEGESFLESNDIKIKSEYKVKNKGALKEELANLYRQDKTRYFFGVPRHNFYYAGSNDPDSTWFKRWLRTKLGDEPVIYDSTRAKATVDMMTIFLRQKGYWDGEVDYEVRTEGYNTTVVYNVDPKQRWTVSSIEYRTQDSLLQPVLDSLAQYTLLPEGTAIDVKTFEQDRLRITRSMQNLGYANFFKNSVDSPEADSSQVEKDMELLVTILDPPEEGRHETYDIGEIRIYPDFANEAPVNVDTVIDGVRFLSPEYPFLVKPRVLLRSLYFETGDRYHLDDVDKTRVQMNKLATYRFVAVKPVPSPTDTNVLDYDIILTRNKKMGIGGDIELNYSTLSQTRRNLLGIGFDVNYRHRNLFRGGEFFSSALETGIEFNFRKGDPLINSLQVNLLNSLQLPRFIDPIKFYTGLNKIRIGKNGLLGDKIFSWLKEDNSRINLGYQYLSLVDLYDYHTANFSIGYDATPDPSRRLQLNHFGVEFFYPTTRPQFDEILEDNRYLRESFTPQFFTGLLFKDYQFVYTGRPDTRGFIPTIIQSTEISGLEVLGINSLYNWISGNEGEFVINDTIRFAQFVKFDFDTRFLKKLKRNQEIAIRAAAGVAFPFSIYSREVPYVKQFYIGGPQSIRAWQIRELGPGSYEDPNVPADATQFFQTGDIRLEASIEYRFKIGWILNGAFFLEAGNVWTLREDDQRPGANFSGDFLKEIAVGTGTGLRLDFDYFVIRWDLGYKLRNPFPDENGNYRLWDKVRNFSFSQFNSNFAIGYPF